MLIFAKLILLILNQLNQNLTYPWLIKNLVNHFGIRKRILILKNQLKIKSSSDLRTLHFCHVIVSQLFVHLDSMQIYSIQLLLNQS